MQIVPGAERTRARRHDALASNSHPKTHRTAPFTGQTHRFPQQGRDTPGPPRAPWRASLTGILPVSPKSPKDQASHRPSPGGAEHTLTPPSHTSLAPCYRLVSRKENQQSHHPGIAGKNVEPFTSSPMAPPSSSPRHPSGPKTGHKQRTKWQRPSHS